MEFNTSYQTISTSDYHNLSRYVDDGKGKTTTSRGKYTLEAKGKDSCLTIFLPNLEKQIIIKGGNGTSKDFEILENFTCGQNYQRKK
jgi:hypothetical protein